MFTYFIGGGGGGGGGGGTNEKREERNGENYERKMIKQRGKCLSGRGQ